MNRVIDRGDLRRYRTEIPNMVDDMDDLSVYAYRLYGRLKRVAGDSGVCWQSTDTLATACNMSAGSVVKAKTELVEKGLIDIVKIKNPHGGREYHEIRITNIWQDNLAKYSSSPDEVANSSHELASSPDEVASSPGEVKNKPFKNKPRKKSDIAAPDFDEMTVLEIKQVPEIKIYTSVTGVYPGQAQLPIIYEVIQANNFTQAALQPFWDEWVTRGYRTKNIKWLTEWAVKGQIPGYNGSRASPGAAEPAGYAGLREFIEREGVIDNGNES